MIVAVRQVVINAATTHFKPRLTISAVRSGAIDVKPPIIIARLPKLLKLHKA